MSSPVIDTHSKKEMPSSTYNTTTHGVNHKNDSYCIPYTN